MLAFQNTPEAIFDVPDIETSLEIQSVGPAKFDLTFEISESHGLMVLRTVYMVY